MRTSSPLTLALALGCATLLGCAAKAGQPRSGEPPAVERFYPLRPGSVWTYDVDTGEGVPVLAITRVVAREGNTIQVSSGADPVVYEQRPDGLYRPDRGTYVLKAPLRQGARWDGEGGPIEVTRADFTATSIAGTFNQCVEVLESAPPKEVRTVFCPDVGPVELESSMQMALTGKAARVKAVLRGYDFGGALEAPVTP